jgi:hypothetical protein
MKLIYTILLTSTLVNAQPLTSDAKEYKDVVQTGKEATKLLLETLQKNMQEHMKNGGVMDALNFCSNEASALTQKVNSQLPQGIATKRVSLKFRNPENEAQNDEKKILSMYEELQNTDQKMPEFSVEKIDEHTFKFYKPLTINKPVCLICHGDLSLNQPLKKAIVDKYPLDKAFDYKLNDLRGAVVVTIKK